MPTPLTLVLFFIKMPQLRLPPDERVKAAFKVDRDGDCNATNC